MPRPCTVCNHPNKEAIDQALIDNEPFRHIAARENVTTSALQRHKNGGHITAAMVQAAGVAEIAHADSLLDQVNELKREARAIKDKAEQANDYKTALMGIRELTRIIELLAKLQGELQENQTINILAVSPEWVKTRTAILQSLEPYPDARQAVIKALANG